MTESSNLGQTGNSYQQPGDVPVITDAPARHPPVVVGSVEQYTGNDPSDILPAPTPYVLDALKDSSVGIRDAIDTAAQRRAQQLGVQSLPPGALVGPTWGFWRPGDGNAPPALRGISYEDPNFLPRREVIARAFDHEWPGHPTPTREGEELNLTAIARAEAERAEGTLAQLTEAERSQPVGIALQRDAAAYRGLLDRVQARTKQELGAELIRPVGTATVQIEEGQPGVPGSGVWTVILYPPGIKEYGGPIRALATPDLCMRLRQAGYQVLGEPQQQPVHDQRPTQDLAVPPGFQGQQLLSPGLPPPPPGHQWAVREYDRQGRPVYVQVQWAGAGSGPAPGAERKRGIIGTAKDVINGFEAVLNDPALPPSVRDTLARALEQTGVMKLGVNGQTRRIQIQLAELGDLGKFAGKGTLKVAGGAAGGAVQGFMKGGVVRGAAGAVAGGAKAGGEYITDTVMDAITEGREGFEGLPFEVRERLLTVLLQSEDLPFDALLQKLQARRDALPPVKRRMADWTIKKAVEIYTNKTEPYRTTPGAVGPNAQAGPAAISVAGEVARLAELHRDGVLNEIEFQAAKAKLLGLPPGNTS
ncbi:MAG TPA: SHOCT domain-containing protein [Verrucomicrobiae bacterium]|nr:SHOCT domain-containing protein [Verrucomicrobiae bacterium]